MSVWDALDEIAESSLAEGLCFEGDGEEINESASITARVRNCGRWMRGINPATGGMYKFRYRCGKHLLCQRCAEERANAEQVNITSAMGDMAYIVTLDERDAAKLVRNLRTSGAKYRRYPQEDGSVTIIHDSNTHAGEEASLSDVDWDKITYTPSGKNISGKMKETPLETTPVESAKVVMEAITAVPIEDKPADEANAEIDEIWEEAVAATNDLEPDTETLQECLRKRMTMFKHLLREAGYLVTFSVYRSISVDSIDIDWKPNNLYITEKVKSRK